MMAKERKDLLEYYKKQFESFDQKNEIKKYLFPSNYEDSANLKPFEIPLERDKFHEIKFDRFNRQAFIYLTRAFFQKLRKENSSKGMHKYLDFQHKHSKEKKLFVNYVLHVIKPKDFPNHDKPNKKTNDALIGWLDGKVKFYEKPKRNKVLLNATDSDRTTLRNLFKSGDDYNEFIGYLISDDFIKNSEENEGYELVDPTKGSHYRIKMGALSYLLLANDKIDKIQYDARKTAIAFINCFNLKSANIQSIEKEFRRESHNTSQEKYFRYFPNLRRWLPRSDL
jgi:hypothetical protein